MTQLATSGRPSRRGSPPYADVFEHLQAELRWLDLLIARGVRDLRAAAPAQPGPFVGDDEVDQLLGRAQEPVETALDEQLAEMRTQIDRAALDSVSMGVALPLHELAHRLGLTPFERQALVLCLAPELDRKYDRLYAYLQDDLARRRPSVDLVVGLLEQDASQRWRALRWLAPHAALLRHGVLRMVADPYSPSGSTALAQLMQVTPRFVGHLLGDPEIDSVLLGHARRTTPVAETSPVDLMPEIEQLVVRLVADRSGAMVVYLQGGQGAGAPELARAVSADLAGDLLEFDLTLAPGDGTDVATLVEAALREGWLLGCPVLVTGSEAPSLGLGVGGAPTLDVVLDSALRRYPCLVFVTGEAPWPAYQRLRHGQLHELVVPRTDSVQRRNVWTSALAAAGWSDTTGLAQELAGRFRLSPGQIRDVVADVTRTHGREPGAAAWYAACRRVSTVRLGTLAQEVVSPHKWEDLVLDDSQLEQLHALCDQVRHRGLVLDEWGLGSRLAGGHGLSALFTGPPGTGKTMAAGVVAAELGLDLYRIDLSSVVSKYIGETEKNLAHIFDEAELSDVVLFFDEADALFGKRTKVSDAHDRYANVEISYLLQRMEAYQGIAVLATNLNQNMDEAFVRRLRFVIRFPFPDARHRLRIWRAHLDAGAPLAGDLEDDHGLGVLAERLQLSGGSIRNVVLSAAFLAAAQDRRLGIEHLLSAARRELAKSGALWPEGTFEAAMATDREAS